MKIFDNFSDNDMQFYNYQGTSYEKKDNNIFENELLKSQKRKDLFNNKIKFLNNENIKNTKNKFKDNNGVLINENINQLFEIDNLKGICETDSKDKSKYKDVLQTIDELENLEDLYKKEETLLSNVSVIVDLPKEQIKYIFEELDMNIKDMQDSNNIIPFLEKVFNINDSIDLLEIEQIDEIIRKINEIMMNEENYNNNENNEVNFNMNEENNFNKKIIKTKDNYYYDKEKIDIDNIPYVEEEHEIKLEIDENNSSLFNNKEKKDNGNLLNNRSEQFLENENNSIEKLNIYNFNNNKYTKNIEDELVNLSLDKKMDEIKNNNVIEQITSKISSNFKVGISELKIKLNPVELGEVTLKVSTEKGVVSAQFIIENNKIKEIIESRFNELKDILNKEGIDISQLSVSVEDESKDNYMKEFLKEKEKSKEKVKKIMGTIVKKHKINEEISAIKHTDISKNSIDCTA